MASAEQATARDGFAESSPEDQDRTSRWAFHFVAIKQAAEFFGRRPRRFIVLMDGTAGTLGPGAKRVHLMRHGEGHHNVWRAAAFAAGRVPHAKRGNLHEVPAELHDPSLTEKGRGEAIGARAAARLCSPQLLVTSPLRRAIQTLLLAFSDAVDKGTPIVAHELCREQFRGLDPSVYDARRPRGALAEEFPQIDFASYVLPEPDDAPGHACAGDPLWWLCGSPLGSCEGGLGEAAMVEHAYGFLSWLMARPESEIGVATHSLFLLALYHGALDPPDGTPYKQPQLFHTGELRSVVIKEITAPESSGACLSVWGPALVGGGLADGRHAGDPAGKRPRLSAA